MQPGRPPKPMAYRTFRAGDGGDWTARVLTEGGRQLGAAAFTVEVS